ncbi:uncharacterized protein V1518DRAFT_421287 [Limtongia smithiae]|uniref:uncharacterized protein n=1 Tax=Limtongia smithiae TaxID=1125753 RepID=UPI0034CEC0D0
MLGALAAFSRTRSADSAAVAATSPTTALPPRCSQQHQQLLVSGAFLSSVIVLFLVAGPLVPLSSAATSPQLVSQISTLPPPPVSGMDSAALRSVSSILGDMRHEQQRELDVASGPPVATGLSDSAFTAAEYASSSSPTELRGPRSRRADMREAAIMRRQKAGRRYKPAPIVPSTAEPHDEHQQRPPPPPQQQQGEIGDMMARKPPKCNIVIDPPMFSPPDKRAQSGFVVLVVGVITLVTAGLMM